MKMKILLGLLLFGQLIAHIDPRAYSALIQFEKYARIGANFKLGKARISQPEYRIFEMRPYLLYKLLFETKIYTIIVHKTNLFQRSPE